MRYVSNVEVWSNHGLKGVGVATSAGAVAVGVYQRVFY